MFNKRKTALNLSNKSNSILNAFDKVIKGLTDVSDKARKESVERKRLAEEHLVESEKLNKLAFYTDKRVAKISELFNIDENVPVETETNKKSIEELMKNEGGN